MNNNFLKSVSIISLLFIMLLAKKQVIIGEVRVVGTYIFPNVVISENNIDYYFDEDFFEEYSKYQGKIISIEARVKKETLWLADKSKSFDRYTIKWVRKIE
ncbi:hypothetical protein [Brachyspira pilosicoli]|uniref:Uncharacterized protein n=1 Tax=Brachyspira pilosicoli TaxID=52584 RepID=A0A5C8ESQ2_BRAPL|nr:hypothetical protein [Brachyspira pilosicoli]TXJ41069.1 hypothetical protein EPJ72_07695 [Brachyspira pilosicoli]